MISLAPFGGHVAASIAVLSVRDLTVTFQTKRGCFAAVRGVSFDILPGRVLGIAGESGSGKSMTAMAVMQLLPDAARIDGGDIRLDGRSLIGLTDRQMGSVRGREIAMVFQDPMGSLNPLLTIGFQVGESLRRHVGLAAGPAAARVLELLALVRIPSPEQIMGAYPHELSGGMRQRVMIAIALSCAPKLLIADEPTTALDVTTQAQILALLRDLQRRLNMAVLLITHDLGVLAEFADDVMVMYAGRVVECAPAELVFEQPAHPYSEGLLRSMPPLGGEELEHLPAIGGNAANPLALPPGCAFHPRCDYAWEACARSVPPAIVLGPGRTAACFRHGGPA